MLGRNTFSILRARQCAKIADSCYELLTLFQGYLKVFLSLS
jgi:hypothetical protein